MNEVRDDLEYIIKDLFPKLTDKQVFWASVLTYLVIQAGLIIFSGSCLYVGLKLASMLFE